MNDDAKKAFLQAVFVSTRFAQEEPAAQERVLIANLNHFEEQLKAKLLSAFGFSKMPMPEYPLPRTINYWLSMTELMIVAKNVGKFFSQSKKQV